MLYRVMSCLVLLVSLLFAAQAKAQYDPTGFDLRVGLSPALVVDILSTKTADVSTDDEAYAAGMNLNISLGYRWKWFGIYLDQDFGGMWRLGTSPIDHYLDNGLFIAIDPQAKVPPKHRFLGGTYVFFRFIWDINPMVSLSGGLGIGAMYGAGNSKTWRRAFISGIHNEAADVAMATKFQLQTTFYFCDAIGFGLTLEMASGYSMGGAKKMLDDPNVAGLKNKAEWESGNIVLQSGIHVNFRF